MTDAFCTLEDVTAFIEALEARRLPREQWTHHAHLVAGLWYVHQLGYPGCLDVVRRRIREHNESVGTANTDSSGYHETITGAYLRGIARCVARAPGRTLMQHVSGLLASPLSQRDWLLRFYSKEVLFSVDARRGWVEPDVSAIEVDST